tara:strand:- start:231 stop:809 length:579 start_codon:yes stop_codon:yes gene_type:complete
MAKEILFMRHSSLVVPRGICYGVANIDVSSDFHMEVENLQRSLNGFTPDLVISSPLQRCVKLAVSAFGIEPEINSNLKEIDYGDWEGESWEDIAIEGGNLWMYKNTLNSPPNGESFAELKLRVVKELQNILKRSEEKIAVVCHGGVIRSVLSYFLKTPLEDTRSYHIHYTGFVKFINTEESWRLSEFNSASL